MKKPTVRYRGEIRWLLQEDDWIAKFHGEELGRVVLDNRYPGMRRVKTLSGRVSDMVNLSRAKDALVGKILSDGARTRSVR